MPDTLYRSITRALPLIGVVLLSLSAAWRSQATPPAGSAIGVQPANLTFQDLRGRSHTLLAPKALPAVYLFLSTECPVANVYTPRIVALERHYRAKGVHFFGVNANTLETRAQIARHAKARGYVFPLIKDDGALAARLGATMTPQAVVLDRNGVVRYRGRIDDHRDPTRVRSHDLRDALDAMLAGKPVPRPEAPAYGCPISTVPAAGARRTASVTFARDVAPILNKHCVACHRPGEVGPFPLQTYEQAAARAEQIKTYTARRLMPPWKADSNGEFVNERRLTDKEILTLAAWAKAGAPKGDPKSLPVPPRFPKGWSLGTPDAVFEMKEAYTLAADGPDVYRCFVLPTDYAEDRWITAMEVRPGNRAVVHHVIAYLDTGNQAERLDAADPGPGYSSSGGGPGFLPSGALGGWAPGNEPRPLPPGVGIRLPKGAKIVLEVHYSKSGKPETDRTKIGLHFCDTPVERQLQNIPILNFWFRIPPGDANHVVRAHYIAPTDLTVLQVTPHMHLLGREMTLTATLPDGTKRPLIRVPDWDFNWQTTYVYKEPVKLPKGTRIDLVARYDNSEKNMRNPHKPPRAVGWGEQTSDEMCIAFVGVTVDGERLTKGVKAGPLLLGGGLGGF